MPEQASKQSRRGGPGPGTGQATRQRILAAALEAFETVGYSGATIVGIARNAGISHAALYRYFPSKAALYRELLAEHRALLAPMVLDVTAEPDPRRALHLFAVAWLERNEADPDWVALSRMLLRNKELDLELQRVQSEAAPDRPRPITDALVGMVRRLAEEGHAREDIDPVVDAQKFFDLLQSVAYVRLLDLEVFPARLTNEDVAHWAVAGLMVTRQDTGATG